MDDYRYNQRRKADSSRSLYRRCYRFGGNYTGCRFRTDMGVVYYRCTCQPICYFALSVLKPKFGYDDALDAFGCHGIGGIWGGIATGLFAQTSINPVAKWDGLVFGDYHLFVAQVLSILVTIAVAVVGTLICVGIVRLFTKLRVDENSENVGLDDSEHGERAYSAIWE